MSILSMALLSSIWRLPKTRGPILVVLVIRIIVYLGLFWGPLFMETPISLVADMNDKDLLTEAFWRNLLSRDL